MRFRTIIVSCETALWYSPQSSCGAKRSFGVAQGETRSVRSPACVAQDRARPGGGFGNEAPAGNNLHGGGCGRVLAEEGLFSGAHGFPETSPRHRARETAMSEQPDAYLEAIEGEVKWFDPRKGYGFIVGPEGQDIFAHYTVIEGDGFRVLRDGAMVTYDAEHSSKGWKATRVARVVPEPEIRTVQRDFSRSPRR